MTAAGTVASMMTVLTAIAAPAMAHRALVRGRLAPEQWEPALELPEQAQPVVALALEPWVPAQARLEQVQLAQARLEQVPVLPEQEPLAPGQRVPGLVQPELPGQAPQEPVLAPLVLELRAPARPVQVQQERVPAQPGQAPVRPALELVPPVRTVAVAIGIKLSVSLLVPERLAQRAFFIALNAIRLKLP